MGASPERPLPESRLDQLEVGEAGDAVLAAEGVGRPIASWAESSAQASGQPKIAPSSETEPTTAWLKRGARASITSVSRQGSAVRAPCVGMAKLSQIRSGYLVFEATDRLRPLIPLKDNVPTARLPVVTIALIAVNIAVFVWQLTFLTNRSSSPQLERLGVNERDQNSIAFGAIPYRITHPGKTCFIGEKPSSRVSARAARWRPAPGRLLPGTPAGGRAEANGPTATVAEAPWYVTVFTSMFMHGGILHIAFNMLFLWIFGNNVEDAMGRGRYLLFYLLAGLVAVYSQAALTPTGRLP